jgi:hypothetical protein
MLVHDKMLDEAILPCRPLLPISKSNGTAPRHRAPVGCNGIKGSKLKVRNKKKKKKKLGG